jgi:tetratricopeptide (TPR) repeat protein
MTRSEFAQAIRAYESALDIDPMNQIAKDNIVLAHNNWGIAYFHQRKYEEARAEWEKALQMNAYDKNAKQNLAVLKSAMARMGVSQPAERPAEKVAPEKKEAPPKDEGAGGVVLLNSGSKHTSDAPPENAALKTPVSVPPEPTPSNVQIMNSPYSIPMQSSQQKQSNDESNPYITPTNLPVRNRARTAPSQKAPSTPPAWTPPATNFEQPAQTTSPESSQAADSSTNLEEKISAVETKLYGRKQKGTLIKRIEKLEMDVSGQTKTGTLQDRVEAVRQNCGK